MTPGLKTECQTETFLPVAVYLVFYVIDIAAVHLQFGRKRELTSGDEIVFFELMWCVGVFSPVRLLQRRERNGKRRREQTEGRRQNKMRTSSHLKIMTRRSFEDDDSEDEEGTSWSNP
jgi:hypothetical protein